MFTETEPIADPLPMAHTDVRQIRPARRDTKREAELQAEAIAAYWKERGHHVDVVVEQVRTYGGGVVWSARVVTPFNTRGWPA